MADSILFCNIGAGGSRTEPQMESLLWPGKLPLASFARQRVASKLNHAQRPFEFICLFCDGAPDPTRRCRRLQRHVARLLLHHWRARWKQSHADVDTGGNVDRKSVV